MLKFPNNQKYLVFDGETCHLNLCLPDNKTWEWAWLECQGEEIVSKADYYIKWPNLNISKEAALMTHFNPLNIQEKGVDPKMVIEKLDNFIYNTEYMLIAANGLRFDIYLHNIHRRLVGLPTDYSYIDRVIDPVALARGIKTGVTKDNNTSLYEHQLKVSSIRQKGLKTSVRQLCQDYGIPYDETQAHNALWDVETLWKIWLKMKAQLENE